MLRRHSLEGFWDRAEFDGPISGSGPGFEHALSEFHKRQARLSEIGRWRAGSNARDNVSRGTYVDRDWDIIDF